VAFFRYTPILAGLGAAVALAASAVLGADAQSQQIGITINGNQVQVEPAPIMQAGRVFVPLRGVFENLGASVVYESGQINATGNGREIALHIGSHHASVNGSPETIDVAPFIVGASTYVPLRFVSQALGANVDWDDSNQLVAITMAGAPPYQGGGQNYDDVDASYQVDQAPPPLPYDDPPPVPDPNWIWMPGYWAWGQAGFYWVPGAWVPAPQPGLLWTPGYWGWQNGMYGWNPGYWALTVGFYGGVNYGGGYYGHGYAGGRWSNGHFRYNTAVVRVSVNVTNVYVDRTVVVNAGQGSHPSYNGGSGVAARPTAAELATAHARHVPMTALQTAHVKVASQDRQLLSKVNAGKPPVVAVPRPLTPAAKPAGFTPVTPQDKAAVSGTTVRRAPTAVRPAPPAPAAAPPRAPVQPAPVHPAPMRPAVVHPAPAPAVHPAPAAPVARPPQQRPAARPPAAQPPAARPPAARPPVAHPPPAHPPAARPPQAPRPVHTAPP
jgi:hypothetical protein